MGIWNRLRNTGLILAAATGLLACGSMINAQPPAGSADELAEVARAAKAHYQPVDADDVAQARERLERALTRMDARLAEAGARGDDWRAYLMRDELAAALASDQPDYGQLAEISRKYTGKHEGLEEDAFRAVRGALADYADRVAVASSENPQGDFEQLVDALADALERYQQNASTEDIELIGFVVGELQRRGQAPELVSAVRRRYSHPNLKAYASADLLDAAIGGPVDDVAPVEDVILGTQVVGTGRTTGEVNVELAPGSRWAVIDIVLSGVTHSDTVGYNGPVRIYNDGTTWLKGRKRIWIDADGVHSHPAAARARTETVTRGIDTDKRGFVDRIVRRIAWKKIGEKKSASQRIAAEHAAERAEDRMDEQAADLVADANRGFHEKLIHPARRQNVSSDGLRFTSTTDRIHLSSVVDAGDRLAAPGPAPELDGEADLSIVVHESMANNLARQLLSGLRLTQVRAREIALNLSDDDDEDLPKWLIVDEEKGPWSITFAEDRPLSVQFADGSMTLTIHGTNYVVDGIAHPTKMDVTMVYRLEPTDEGYRGVRQGEPRVFPPGFDPDGDQTLSVQETALKGNMENKFDEILVDSFSIDRLDLPGTWAEAGPLRVVRADAQNGWLSLAWRRETVAAGTVTASTEGAAGAGRQE